MLDKDRELEFVSSLVFQNVEDFPLAEPEKPDGTKDNPAMSCKDLKACYPDLDDGTPSSDDISNRRFLSLSLGYYWIDPNEGCPFDAVHVYCDFSGGNRSCVNATNVRVRIPFLLSLRVQRPFFLFSLISWAPFLKTPWLAT